MTFAKYKVKNYAEGQLLSGIGNSTLSLTLKSGEGAKFPTITAPETFIATIEKRTGTVVTNRERVLVTGRTGDVINFTRSFDGDTAIVFSANDYFCLHADSEIIKDLQDETARLETSKLDASGFNNYRIILDANSIIRTNASGDEVPLVYGANGTFLKSNGPTSAPSRSTTGFDINAQPVISPVNADIIPFYDTSGAVVGKTILASIFKLIGFFGDGSDGDVTISGTVTLARDMFYRNLTIPTGQILNPNGFRVYVQESLTGGGSIRRNGNNGSGVTAGATLNQGSLNMEIGAGNGATGFSGGTSPGGAGTAGTLANPAMTTSNGSAGGAGGGYSGSTGSTAGVLGGVSTRGANFNKIFNGLLMFVHGATQQSISSFAESYKSQGAGGGGSSGGASSVGTGGNGGGAGGNGGSMRFCVYNWNFTGSVQGIGGNGANGTNGSGGASGGGGGGGGGNGSVFFRIYAILTNESTITLTGGTAGTGGTGFGGGGSGASGTAGSVGTNITLPLTSFIV